jgi:glycosyltransferase involved in cell wall biosynthesis
MIGRPQVSVIMPAYNVAPFILESVRSVLGQSFHDLELFVVDDGSGDGTADQLASVKDPRLKIIQQANGGSSSARNSGIKVATGEYVGFIDADDLWSPNKLETHITFLEQHPEVDLTFSRSELIDEGGSPTGRTSAPVSGEVSFQDLLTENVVNNGSAVVMRRKALDLAGHFDTELKACVDWDLWLRVAMLRPRNIFCVDGSLTKYRMRSGQITKDWRRMEAAWNKMFAKMLQVAGAQVAIVAKEARARFYRYLAYIAYENHDYANSVTLLRRAMGLSALKIVCDRRTWVLMSALLARGILPDRIHGACDAMARRLRSRRHSGVYAHR